MSAGDRHPGDLSDVQRRGIATAMDAFDRLIDELDGIDGSPRRADAGLAGADRDGPTDLPQLRAAVARTFDVYADLFRRTLELYADVVETVLRSGRQAALPADATDGEVALAGAPGTEAVAAVWIHNRTTAPVDDIVLRMTDLTAHDGRRIAASAASFAPPRLAMGSAASRSSSLSVRVPRSAVPGTYVGHVLATGLPGAALAVSLVVAP
jgi:hypothetical protein